MEDGKVFAVNRATVLLRVFEICNSIKHLYRLCEQRRVASSTYAPKSEIYKLDFVRRTQGEVCIDFT